MIVATKRIRKHASVIPYFLIEILLSLPVSPSGACPAPMALLLKGNVPCRLFRRLTLGGDSNTAGLRSGQCIRYGPRSNQDPPLRMPARFLSVQQFASTPEF